MDTKKMIDRIIPPADYEHRNGFSNTDIIDKLSETEKKQVEEILIHKLLFEADKLPDVLIVETLVYLKSEKSTPILYDLMNKCDDNIIKIKIAASIFEINHDSNLIPIAVSAFKRLDTPQDPYYTYRLITSFDYLIKFGDARIKEIIQEYAHHPDFSTAYNAKRVLGI